MNLSSSGRSRRIPTIYLQHDAVSQGHPALAAVSRRYSSLEGKLSMSYSPLCRSTNGRSHVRARLACLIHAASVRSEPGSNPSLDLSCVFTVRRKRRADPTWLRSDTNADPLPKKLHSYAHRASAASSLLELTISHRSLFSMIMAVGVRPRRRWTLGGLSSPRCGQASQFSEPGCWPQLFVESFFPGRWRLVPVRTRRSPQRAAEPTDGAQRRELSCEGSREKLREGSIGGPRRSSRSPRFA